MQAFRTCLSCSVGVGFISICKCQTKIVVAYTEAADWACIHLAMTCCTDTSYGKPYDDGYAYRIGCMSQHACEARLNQFWALSLSESVLGTKPVISMLVKPV